MRYKVSVTEGATIIEVPFCVIISDSPEGTRGADPSGNSAVTLQGAPRKTARRGTGRGGTTSGFSDVSEGEEGKRVAR